MAKSIHFNLRTTKGADSTFSEKLLTVGTAGLLNLDADGNPSLVDPDELGAVTSVASRTGDVTLTKTDVGLANVDNTTDANKPVSTAAQTALDGKEASQTAASQAEAEAGTESAIRKFSPLRIKQAIDALGGGGAPEWEDITGIPSGIASLAADLVPVVVANELANKADTGLMDMADAALAADITSVANDLNTVAGLVPDTVMIGADATPVTNNATMQSVSGLSFSMAANTNYELVGIFDVETSATGTGLEIGVTGPAGLVDIKGSGTFTRSLTAIDGAFISTAYGTFLAGANGATSARPFAFRLAVSNGATSGTLQFQVKLKAAASGSITIKSGSYFRHSKL